MRLSLSLMSTNTSSQFSFNNSIFINDMPAPCIAMRSLSILMLRAINSLSYFVAPPARSITIYCSHLKKKVCVSSIFTSPLMSIAVFIIMTLKTCFWKQSFTQCSPQYKKHLPFFQVGNFKYPLLLANLFPL